MTLGVGRIAHFMKQDLWTKDLAGLPVVERTCVQTLRLAIAVALEFRHRLLDARAAGLVYTTLLSLVPILAVMFSVLKAFGVHHQMEPFLAQALEPLGPKGVEITTRIIDFVDNLKIGVLGAAGFAGLFYTTYSLIDKIEQALNSIWMVRQGRPWSRKFADYLSAVLVGPVLVFTAFGMLASLQSHTFVQQLMEIEPFGSLLVWAAKLIPFLLLSGVFTFFYKFIPFTQVRTSSAVIGGITAAILWGIAGEVFAKFVASSAKYSAIYSGFAVLVLFLLWLYVSWLIVLIGAQFSFFHQYPTAYLSRLLWQQGTPAFRERLALNLLVIIASRYLQGNRPLRLAELAVKLSMPDSLVEEQVIRLTDAGIIGIMKEPEGVSLVTPPEMISVKQVLDTVREAGTPEVFHSPAPNNPMDQMLQRRDEAVEQALAGYTLRSLAIETMGLTKESPVGSETRVTA